MLHFFINPDTGKTMYIPEMPEYPENNNVDYTSIGIMKRAKVLSNFNNKVQQAKDKAIEVKDQDDVLHYISIPIINRLAEEKSVSKSYISSYGLFRDEIKPDTIYTLDDSYKVEIIEGKAVVYKVEQYSQQANYHDKNYWWDILTK